LNFNGTISGNVYSQPLYVENGPGGAAMVIVMTESSNVYALDAITGAVIGSATSAYLSFQVCRAAISVRSVSLVRLCPSWFEVIILRCHDQRPYQETFHFFVEMWTQARSIPVGRWM
jgi:hypothetical protein